jgi:nitric oxide reductase subunit B
LACVGLLVFYHARNKEEEINEALPLEDPLRNMKPTPSMKATLKYIWVVALLILVQMLAGVITAHYGVEGSGFYGIPLDQFLPQSVSEAGTFNWLYSGLLPHGWQQDCI